MSWYFVNAAGDSQGPVGVKDLQSKYESGELKDDSFVWNGAEVNQWTPLNKVSTLYNQVKPSSQPKPPTSTSSASAPRRGGMGRANLLAGIQAGPQLKKVPEGEKKDTSSAVAPREGEGSSPSSSSSSSASSGSSASSAPSRGPAKMTMQEQMAMVLKNRGGGGGIGGGAKTTPRAGLGIASTTTSSTTSSTATTTNSTSTTKASTPAWKQQRANVSSTSNSITSAEKTIEPESPGSSDNSRIEKIKNLLEGAQEWQLRAIEKILS